MIILALVFLAYLILLTAERLITSESARKALAIVVLIILLVLVFAALGLLPWFRGQ